MAVERLIRAAEPGDVPVVMDLVHELAAYERAPEAVSATEELLAQALFGPERVAGAHLAEHDGAVVGFALWYRTFSTWTGRPGLWLEDLFVRPAARGTGAGRALLESLAALCQERGYSRLEWWVLDWNAPAHGFYRRMGAHPEDEWTVWRLDAEPLAALAQGLRDAAH